ncbi:MAG: hypothetical protein SWQ30_04860 [Thermodesulfobacteriota bacterium]|nr:hypothetical protein [Thermodesulfobacteriota bacterium]
MSKVRVNDTTDYLYDYDDNGNMTDGWNFANLGSVAARDISYNADNKPVSIVMSGTTTQFVYDGKGARELFGDILYSPRQVKNGLKDSSKLSCQSLLGRTSPVVYGIRFFGGSSRILMSSTLHRYVYPAYPMSGSPIIPYPSFELGERPSIVPPEVLCLNVLGSGSLAEKCYRVLYLYKFGIKGFPFLHEGPRDNQQLCKKA